MDLNHLEMEICFQQLDEFDRPVEPELEYLTKCREIGAKKLFFFFNCFFFVQFGFWLEAPPDGPGLDFPSGRGGMEHGT